MNLERQPLMDLLRALSFTFSVVPDSHEVTLKLGLGPRSHSTRVQVVDSSDDALPHSEVLARAIRGPVAAFHRAVAPTRQVDVEITLDQAGQWKATSTQQNNPAHIALRALPLRGSDVALPEMTKERIDELSTGWEKRSHAYQAADGADDEHIAELATALGQPVPPELEAFLRLANGADLSDYDAAEGIAFAWELLGAEQIARAYDNQTGLARDFSMNRIGLTNGAEGATQLRQYHTGWIPFAFDGSGVHLGIDTVPGPNGTAGQIITFGDEAWDGPTVIADSLADLFAGQLVPKVDLPKKQFVLKEPGVFDYELIPDGVQNLGLHNQTGVNFRNLPGEHLKSLQLSGIDDLALEGVADLPLLELSITNVSSVDLSPLANHQTLRVLSLTGIDAINSVEVLTELPTLETVRLGDIEEASEMDVLSALSRNKNLAGVSYGIMSKLSLEELAKRARVLTGSSDGGTTVETGVLD